MRGDDADEEGRAVRSGDPPSSTDRSDLSSRQREVVGVARDILEREGPEALTMARLAAMLGIKAPSLYKHFHSKAELEAAIVAEGLRELARELDSSDGSLRGLAVAYRSWATLHPHLHRLMNEGPLPRALLPEGLEERVVAPLLTVFAGNRNLARAAWAFAMGMMTLEIADRFPQEADLDEAWNEALEAFQRAAERSRRSARTATRAGRRHSRQGTGTQLATAPVKEA
jgi:AcrR family transcriptional regulator